MSYESVVLADTPSLLWMLQETTGTTAADATGNGNTGTYTGGYTQAVTGPANVGNGTGALFDGSTGYVIEAALTGTSPSTFTIECWFKTSSASRGIGGFTHGVPGDAGSFDREVYVSPTPSGAAAGFTYGLSGGTETVTSTGTYDDGDWHYLAYVLGTDAVLYVDGSQVAIKSGAGTPGATYTGGWLAGAVGGLGTDLGPTLSSEYFSGSLAAFATYGYALTSGQVAAHYAAASGGGQGVPLAVPVPDSGRPFRRAPWRSRW